ncbi:cytochrome P450 [Bailinhaonella thermotolerans]|uniref:Cytochrome P450 n=1 Tax=Bailinhaonella thermotolerans TaxID=1070861 RepID=A0A3A4AVR9_9ACTN|nr:cytochrome P450 [Bailinhaonella thermotolerans]RJL32811.1 cytochrome P450 [Bailinhaonella thermotolerans]
MAEAASATASAPRIDIIDPGLYERGGIPHEQFAWLRRHDPVHWHHDPDPDVPGFWVLTRHADITTASRTPECFSSWARGALFKELAEQDLEYYRLMMLNMDPPQHTRQRAFVNRGFTPRMIKQLTRHVTEICDQLIDDVIERGECDFVEDIAAQLPIYVICEMLGAPVTDRNRIFHLSNRLVGFDDPELNTSEEDSKEGAAQILSWALEIAEQRRRAPRDDIISQLLEPNERGETLSDTEICLFVLLLLIAGNETVRNGAAGGMLAFFEHPDQWRRLIEDRDLLATAPDEIVRFVSPVNLMRRMATRDVELGGRTIRAGEKVVFFYSSANRDEEVFADPSVFDVGRSPNPHIGFGAGGPHFCLGTHLARLELRVLFGALLDRMPSIRPAGPARRLRSNFINGLKEMPVAFTPGARRG